MKKFPVNLYVWQDSDDRDEWFVPEVKLESAADMGERKKVGIYKLVKIVTVTGKATVE